MPTSTNVINLKINELTEAQYDAAVQGGIIGENELSILTDYEYARVIQPTTMPTLAVADWALDGVSNKYKQTVNVSGVTASNVVYVDSFPANADEYARCNVLAIAQGAGTLTFQADTVPASALGVNVVILS